MQPNRMNAGLKEENMTKEKPAKSRSTPTQNKCRSEGAEVFSRGPVAYAGHSCDISRNLIH